jgi:hypothetical protein
MVTLRSLFCALLVGGYAVGAVAPAAALPAPVPDVPQQEVLLAQGDCYAIGQRYASQVGGQLARAQPESRGGRSVCVVVVLMPAKDGQRPRREEIVVPID